MIRRLLALDLNSTWNGFYTVKYNQINHKPFTAWHLYGKAGNAILQNNKEQAKENAFKSGLFYIFSFIWPIPIVTFK